MRITVLVLSLASLILSQESRQWEVVKGRDGLPADMKYSYLTTTDKVSVQALIAIGKDGKPLSGTITRPNGYTATMTEKNVDYLWIDRQGYQALWDYWDSNSMLTKHKITAKEFPVNLNGEVVRVVLNSGKKLIGVLEGGAVESSSFNLKVKNNPVQFLKSVVTEIQWR
jgi:hypothetical protein